MYCIGGIYSYPIQNEFDFSWEPALETLNSQDVEVGVKKTLQFSAKTVTFELRHENKRCSACPKDNFSCF